ncbi:hypothetical protein [Anaerobaca lacustris]|uniref:Uncharacterized protein n=1 Tax=Anaerobaca lacustris TaxID=3044600 RepID=A0AAW6U2M7_9BACT|nr:hypothetical protein [Sedimentisphaerales bacterium M17dextr]
MTDVVDDGERSCPATALKSRETNEMNHKRFAIGCGVFVAIVVGLSTCLMVWRAAAWMEAIRVEARGRELPADEIRSAFTRLTEHELPEKADNLRAIYEGGRDPGIFVRFTTDAEGIAFIVETLRRPRSTDTTLSAEEWCAMKRFGPTMFVGPMYWQMQLDIHLFDPNSIASARVLKSGPIKRTRFEVLIDHEHHTVYIYAYKR